MTEEESAILRRLAELMNKRPKPEETARAELVRSFLANLTPPASKAKLPINAFAKPKATLPNRFLPLKAAQPKPANPFLVKLRVSKPKVFVSFDYENDRHYKLLLNAWDANKKFDFVFGDKTPQEIQSNDIGRIKAVLTQKVQRATHTIVLAGRYSNQRHADSLKIGCLNWIHFEIQQSLAYKKKLLVVLLPGGVIPSNAVGQPGVLVDGFSEKGIINALLSLK